MKPLKKPVVEKTIDLCKESRVVINDDQEDQRQDHGAVKDDQRLASAGFDSGRQKTTDKQPDQNGKENKVTYEESKGQ